MSDGVKKISNSLENGKGSDLHMPYEAFFFFLLHFSPFLFFKS